MMLPTRVKQLKKVSTWDLRGINITKVTLFSPTLKAHTSASVLVEWLSLPHFRSYKLSLLPANLKTTLFQISQA